VRRGLRPGRILVALALLADVSAAQVRAGADAELATRYVWRGVSRTERAVVQVQGYGYLPQGRGGWMAGAWAGFEPWSPEAGAPTVSGLDGSALHEWDAWVQRDFIGGGLSASIGAIGYFFSGDAASGGRSDSLSTAELYLRVSQFEGIRLVVPTLVLAWDVWRVDGGYLELQLHRRVPVLPVGPLRTLELGATTGFSLGQRRTSDAEGYFDRNSFTHVDLSIGLSPRFHVGRLPLTAFTTGHWKIGIDDATKPNGLWLELGFSITPPNGDRELE
jgi:hypothetical protein